MTTTYHFTDEQLRKLLEETIGMYEEELKRKTDMALKWPETKFREKHVKSAAQSQAIQEMVEGLDAEQELAQMGQCKPSQIILQADPSAMVMVNYYARAQARL